MTEELKPRVGALSMTGMTQDELTRYVREIDAIVMLVVNPMGRAAAPMLIVTWAVAIPFFIWAWARA